MKKSLSGSQRKNKDGRSS